jgi:hypothetical protein
MVAARHMVAVAGLDVVTAGEEVAPAGERDARSRRKAALVPPGRPQRPGGTRSGHRILRICGCMTQRQNARVTQKRRATYSWHAVPVLWC